MVTSLAPQQAAAPTLANAAAALRNFFLVHDSVRLCEGGGTVARLGGTRAGYSIACDDNRLVCHFWSPEANLVRRVISVDSDRGARLRLQCLRLGQSRPSVLTLEGESGLGDEGVILAQRREDFRGAVVAAAERAWHGWKIDTRASRSAARSPVLRLLFRRQQRSLPCIAVSGDESSTVAASALAQALLWEHAVRCRYPSDPVAALRLILPPYAIEPLRLRRPGLCDIAPIECFEFDRSAGELNSVVLSDDRTPVSALPRAPTSSCLTRNQAESEILAEIHEFCPQATWEIGPEGRGRVRFYGLEILRQASGAEALAAPYTFGAGAERSPLLDVSRQLFHRFLRDLAYQRVAGRDRRHPLYALQPERWMEHLIRSDPTVLDPYVDMRFVYSQLPVCASGHRDVLDLLALDRSGRLLVLELKADEDLDFPLQALDYWLRVRHHQLQGDFERLGYFPGTPVSPLPPRLWMVAPALRWHPFTDRLTRWLSPDVPWTRLGINEEWRHGLQVVFRLDSPSG